jgi:ABC-type branched-subunit amino acid transport system ATPase component
VDDSVRAVDLPTGTDGPDAISSPPAAAGPLLNVRNLSVHYGGVAAITDVSLSVSKGSLTGLIGPNGAGKTTFLDALSGFVGYTGSVEFEGRSFDRLRPHRRQRAGIGRTFQSLELYDDLTVLDNLLISASPSLKGIAPELLWGRAAEHTPRVEQLLDTFELRPFAARLVTELSQGQRKLVAVARALAGDPLMVLLDEPAAGLDSRESRWLGGILRRVSEDGTTLLLVDHDMSLVLGVCDVVHVLDFGELIASGPPDAVRSDAAVVAAYLGTGHEPGAEDTH